MKSRDLNVPHEVQKIEKKSSPKTDSTDTSDNSRRMRNIMNLEYEYARNHSNSAAKINEINQKYLQTYASTSNPLQQTSQNSPNNLIKDFQVNEEKLKVLDNNTPHTLTLSGKYNNIEKIQAKRISERKNPLFAVKSTSTNFSSAKKTAEVLTKKKTFKFEILEFQSERSSLKFFCYDDLEIYKNSKCKPQFVSHEQDDDKDSEPDLVRGAVRLCHKQLIEAINEHIETELKKNEKIMHKACKRTHTSLSRPRINAKHKKNVVKKIHQKRNQTNSPGKIRNNVNK